VEVGKIYYTFDVDGFYQLIETGTYRVVVDGNGETTGDYSFRFLDGDRATFLPLNTPTNSSLSLNPSSTNLYHFSGAVGQHIYIDAGGGQASNAWSLFSPTGDYITSGYVQDNYADDYEFDLTNTGQYTLAVLGRGATNPNYRISVNGKALGG
jgi:large repetitive protein